MEFSPWDRPPLTAARPDSTMGGENALWEETDMDIQGLQKMTLLDYPGRVACTVFLGGCDLRCPFCHNGGLVLGPMPAELDSEELLAFLTELAEASGVPPALFAPLYKTIGIALVVQVGGGLCRDAGESALASVVETAGAVCALVAALPLLRAVLEMLLELMG